jgi:hypothetical protein
MSMSTVGPLRCAAVLAVLALCACEGPPPDAGLETSHAAVQALSASTAYGILNKDVTLFGDWKVYAVAYPTNVIFTAGITSKISPITMVGGAVKAMYTGPLTLPKIKWTNGVPTGSGSTTQGLKVTAVGQGFQFTVPASTTPMELRIYASAYNARGQLEGTFSNGTGPSFSAVDYPLTTIAEQVVATQYKATADNQTITFTWKMVGKSASDGFLGLMAIQYAPCTRPSTTLTLDAPATPPYYLNGDTLTFRASLDHPDYWGGIQVFRDAVPLGVINYDYTSLSVPASAGHHVYTAQATTGIGLVGPMSAPLAADVYYHYSDGPYYVPGGLSGPMNDPVTLTGAPTSGPGSTIAAVKIRVDITQPVDQYLDLTLTGNSFSPAVTLAAGLGGSASNYKVTTFSDDAPLAITQGTAPFNGTFRPQQSMAATFQGRPLGDLLVRTRNRDPNGNWTWMNKLDVYVLPQ